jgi:hypothetical protein
VCDNVGERGADIHRLYVINTSELWLKHDTGYVADDVAAEMIRRNGLASHMPVTPVCIYAYGIASPNWSTAKTSCRPAESKVTCWRRALLPLLTSRSQRGPQPFPAPASTRRSCYLYRMQEMITTVSSGSSYGEGSATIIL